MEIGNIIRLLCVMAGIFLMGLTIVSLAKRRMTETFCLAWAVVSVIMIAAGIVLNPTQLGRYISVPGLILVVVVVVCVAYASYFMSVKISELIRKNQELAIQVSLLNQENRRIMSKLEELLEVQKREI